MKEKEQWAAKSLSAVLESEPYILNRQPRPEDATRLMMKLWLDGFEHAKFKMAAMLGDGNDPIVLYASDVLGLGNRNAEVPTSFPKEKK